MNTKPPNLFWIILIAALVLVLLQKTSPQNDDAPQTAHAPKTVSSEQKRPPDPSLVLKELVQSHPAEEIRVDLNNMIERRELFLNFETSKLTPGMGSVATVLYVNTPTHGLVLTLSIDADQLTDPDVDRTYKQLVIYHEYQHILQRKAGKITKEELFSRRVDVPMTQPEIYRLFLREEEAYAAECELAVKLNKADAFAALCVPYQNGGRRAMRETLAELYARVPYFSPHAAFMRSLAKTM